MPRWPEGYVARKWQKCPSCGGKKDFDAKACRRCTPKPAGWAGTTGANHPAWKGGFRIDRDGYIKTYAPDHPWPRVGGYVYEHDRLMELHIGRRLLPNETVHHIDENKRYNELGNFKLLERGPHVSHHRELDKHLAVRDSSGRYAPRTGGVKCLQNI